MHLNDFSTSVEKMKLFTIVLGSLITDDKRYDETKPDSDKVPRLTSTVLINV